MAIFLVALSYMRPDKFFSPRNFKTGLVTSLELILMRNYKIEIW